MCEKFRHILNMSIREFAVINYRNFCVCIASIILLFATNNKSFAQDSFSPAVTMVTTIANQQLLYNQIFERAEMFMFMPESERVLMRYHNKYAYTGAGQQVFSPTFIPDKNAGVWVKSFVLFENLPLGNGPDVSNVGYATLIGYDTDLKHYKNGWDAVYTVHGTYQGSRENFKATSSIDNYGTGGVTGAFFKKKFFIAATAISGADYTYENVGKGEQNFRISIFGVASKVGYNIEFKKGKYILQPGFLGDYSYSLASDFQSSDGKSGTGDPLNVIHVSPGIKLIANLKDGWQPYLAISETWTLMDSPAIYKNGVLQQRINIAPYFEYGGGLQRRWKDRYTSFGQILFRGGGRNGVSFYFGFRVAIGKDFKASGKDKAKTEKDKPKEEKDEALQRKEKITEEDYEPNTDMSTEQETATENTQGNVKEEAKEKMQDETKEDTKDKENPFDKQLPKYYPRH